MVVGDVAPENEVVLDKVSANTVAESASGKMLRNSERGRRKRRISAEEKSRSARTS